MHMCCERTLQAIYQMNLLSLMVCFCLQDPPAFSLALVTSGLMFCVLCFMQESTKTINRIVPVAYFCHLGAKEQVFCMAIH